MSRDTPPKDPKIKELWDKRRKLWDESQRYTDAINALQKICSHDGEIDVSMHGSPDYWCPDCGNMR